MIHLKTTYYRRYALIILYNPSFHVVEKILFITRCKCLCRSKETVALCFTSRVNFLFRTPKDQFTLSMYIQITIDSNFVLPIFFHVTKNTALMSFKVAVEFTDWRYRERWLKPGLKVEDFTICACTDICYCTINITQT